MEMDDLALAGLLSSVLSALSRRFVWALFPLVQLVSSDSIATLVVCCALHTPTSSTNGPVLIFLAFGWKIMLPWWSSALICLAFGGEAVKNKVFVRSRG